MKIVLEISYFGKNYSGWQFQKNGRTVQGEMTSACEKLFGFHVNVTGCSRTDAGVHANSYFCTISSEKDLGNIPCEKLPLALNCNLPDDISCRSAKIVDDSFHPRYDVKYKEYKYLIWNGKTRNPFLTGRSFEYPRLLDEKTMDQAAKFFVGKHDFSGFMSSGTEIENTVREIFDFSVCRNGDLISIRVSADGFLYNMVRILVGTLIEVSEGKIKLEEIKNIIEAKDRKRAGFTARPEGLYLNKVVY